MAVHPDPDVDLRHGGEAGQPELVDEQAGLDPVSGKEGHRVQQVAGARELAGQRLREPGQLGENTLNNGLAVSSVTRPPPSAVVSRLSPVNGRRKAAFDNRISGSTISGPIVAATKSR
jgi:hypothetical protein